MHVFFLGFLVSLAVTMLVLRYSHLHAHFSGDSDISGAQKFHRRVVPRIGGVGVMLGVVVVAIVQYFRRPDIGHSFLLLLLASLPAFLGGVAEDLTKRVGAFYRLMLTMGAALLGFWLLHAALTRVGVPMLDGFLTIAPIALFITAIAVGGVANAINIIDGFNGLAAIVAVMILGALGYVSYILGDYVLWNICFASMGSILGFFVWNYPRGLIFLGDGGAYLIGFLIGEISILLVARHAEVSPWFPMLLVIYPVFETLFSIYRKKMLRGISPGVPDGLHLHMLVFKRLVRWASGGCDKSLSKQNAATSPYLWMLCSISIIPALLFWKNTLVLILCVLCFSIIYVWLYWRLVRFRAPRILINRGPR